MNISIVIPLLNEEESLPELSAWIDKVMQKQGFDYEIIFVDDGSTDTSWQVITDLRRQNPAIKAVRFQRNYGKSAALYEGFAVAQGDVVCTMDADLQDSPDELPEMYRMITQDGYDIVSGWKKKRYDPISKTIPSKFFNGVTRIMSGIKLNDFNCGLKAYRNDVVKNIEVYGEMHRYIPVLAKWAGYTKIGEKVVEHRARKYGVTKFGLSRFINGFLDLMTISFVGRFGKRPMHFFGSLGALSVVIGFGILFYLACQKLIWGIGGIATRPMFFLGILLLIVGTQLFVTGFLAEIITRNSPERNNYKISERIE